MTTLWNSGKQQGGLIPDLSEVSGWDGDTFVEFLETVDFLPLSEEVRKVSEVGDEGTLKKRIEVTHDTDYLSSTVSTSTGFIMDVKGIRYRGVNGKLTVDSTDDMTKSPSSFGCGSG